MEHRRRVALEHHAALLHEHGLHVVGEEVRTRGVGRAGVRAGHAPSPTEEGLVAGSFGDWKMIAAFVERAALRGGERAAKELALLGGLRRGSSLAAK